MKKLFVLSILIGISNLVFTQQRAITDSGGEVILYDDGTWVYADGESEATEISTNSHEFKKEKSSDFLLKSQKMNAGFWIDPDKWTFKKSEEDAESEYELQMKTGDLYALVISEEIELPLETLRAAALSNARAVAPDIKVTKEEYRTVNGVKLLNLRMTGTIEGIRFSYLGYYFSNSKGSTQFLCYTSDKLMDEYLEEAEKLLNGFVELK